MIYLDNSATTHKKPKSVLKAVKTALTKYNSNPGRSGHSLSIETALLVLETRQTIANAFGAKSPQDVIFTSNATESLNLAIQGLMQTGHVITSVLEHNSVLRVLRIFEASGKITVTYLEPNKNGVITAESVKASIKDNTFLVVLTHLSNVTGAKQPIYQIGKIVKKHNLKFIVDSAQGAGNEMLDVQKCNINCLCLAGHKNLYGIQGVGVLILNNCVLQPIKFGGNGIDSDSLDFTYKPPECYEVGTLPSPSILSLNKGVLFAKNHIEANNIKILKLTAMLINGLNKINNVIVYSNINNCYGVVSFNIKGKSCAEVVNSLDEKFKVLCRGGLSCAPLIHKFFNTIEFGGAVRLSLSVFNNKSEIKKVIKYISILAK